MNCVHFFHHKNIIQITISKTKLKENIPIHFESNNDIVKNNYYLLPTLITNLIAHNKTLPIFPTTFFPHIYFPPKTSSNPIFLRVAHTSVTAVPLHESTAGFSSHRRNSQSTHPA